MTLLLEENPESAVSRSELRKALSLAAKHGPVKLLHHVIRLMFPVEELASSCGKGLRKNKSGREALDAKKISICEGNSLLFKTHYSLNKIASVTMQLST